MDGIGNGQGRLRLRLRWPVASVVALVVAASRPAAPLWSVLYGHDREQAQHRRHFKTGELHAGYAHARSTWRDRRAGLTVPSGAALLAAGIRCGAARPLPTPAQHERQPRSRPSSCTTWCLAPAATVDPLNSAARLRHSGGGDCRRSACWLRAGRRIDGFHRPDRRRRRPPITGADGEAMGILARRLDRLVDGIRRLQDCAHWRWSRSTRWRRSRAAC